MSIQEKIKSWKWRIVKAEYNVKSFADLMGFSASSMSEYMSGKKKPSIDRFEEIENKLKELGV